MFNFCKIRWKHWNKNFNSQKQSSWKYWQRKRWQNRKNNNSLDWEFNKKECNSKLEPSLSKNTNNKKIRLSLKPEHNWFNNDKNGWKKEPNSWKYMNNNQQITQVGQPTSKMTYNCNSKLWGNSNLTTKLPSTSSEFASGSLKNRIREKNDRIQLVHYTMCYYTRNQYFLLVERFD